MKFFILSFFFLISMPSFAKVYTFTQSDSFIKITAQASYFFIPSSFDCFIDPFSVEVDTVKKEIQRVELKFLVEDIKSDLPLRDRIMRKSLFKGDQFKKMAVLIKRPLSQFSGVSEKLKAHLFIRGEWKGIIVELKKEKSQSFVILEGTSLLSLKSLGIDDVSIPFTSIDDGVVIAFKLFFLDL